MLKERLRATGTNEKELQRIKDEGKMGGLYARNGKIVATDCLSSATVNGDCQVTGWDNCRWETTSHVHANWMHGSRDLAFDLTAEIHAGLASGEWRSVKVIEQALYTTELLGRKLKRPC
jgi:hypothetical protein